MEPSTYPNASGASPNANNIQRGVDAAGAAAHDGIDKVAEPAKDAVSRLTGAAHDTVDRLASGASSAADMFSEQTRRLNEASSKAVDFSKSWVQDKPLEAVAAALAIGYILGRLTR